MYTRYCPPHVHYCLYRETHLDLMSHGISLQVSAAAEYLWTSGKTHTLVNCMEFCSLLNTVIRDDHWSEIQVCHRVSVLSGAKNRSLR